MRKQKFKKSDVIEKTRTAKNSRLGTEKKVLKSDDIYAKISKTGTSHAEIRDEPQMIRGRFPLLQRKMTNQQGIYFCNNFTN